MSQRLHGIGTVKYNCLPDGERACVINLTVVDPLVSMDIGTAKRVLTVRVRAAAVEAMARDKAMEDFMVEERISECGNPILFFCSFAPYIPYKVSAWRFSECNPVAIGSACLPSAVGSHGPRL